MNTTKQVSIRLTPADVAKIDYCIEKGYAMNTVDFIRQAVRDKCNEIGAIPAMEGPKQVVFNA